MAEVLSAPIPVDATSYLSSRLRRSPSSKTSFYGTSPDSYAQVLPPGHHVHADNHHTSHHHHHHHHQHHHHHHQPLPSRVSSSLPSSVSSSPRLFSQPDSSRSTSTASTPASSLSLNTKFALAEAPEAVEAVDDPITFPSYEDVGYHEACGEFDPPTSPSTEAFEPITAAAATTSSSSSSSSSLTVAPAKPTDAPKPRTVSDSRLPDFMVTAEDDIALCAEPSRHVDYLSHDWCEEDIWASWRHIVSKRKHYGNGPRLENAAWRTWGKIKHRLRTVSPEKLNWLKDCDVTWLYGPLQMRRSRSLLPCDTPAGSRLSQTNSFLTKKPILKKRSMSEIMLQKSLSASSLLQQATAAVEAQRSVTLPHGLMRPRGMGRTTSDFVPSAFESRSGSGEGTSAGPSSSSSGLVTPGVERRHIHFNNEVEQCIAVEIRDDEDDDEDDDNNNHEHALDEDESEEDLVMMKVSSSKASSKVKISSSGGHHRHRHNTPRNNSFSAESKTIAMLPSTTLKCRDDAPASDETGLGSLSRPWGNSRRLSPSPSQETLRPSRPSTNLFLDRGRGDGEDEDEDDDDEADMSWEPSGAFAPGHDDEHDSLGGVGLGGIGIGVAGGVGVSGAGGNGNSNSHSHSHTSTSTSSTTSRSPARSEVGDEHYGLRRTPSGMFMPVDEDEDDEDEAVATGLFGRVVDTVNTARDIAHVIWNVGWRR